MQKPIPHYLSELAKEVPIKIVIELVWKLWEEHRKDMVMTGGVGVWAIVSPFIKNPPWWAWQWVPALILLSVFLIEWLLSFVNGRRQKVFDALEFLYTEGDHIRLACENRQLERREGELIGAWCKKVEAKMKEDGVRKEDQFLFKTIPWIPNDPEACLRARLSKLRFIAGRYAQ